MDKTINNIKIRQFKEEDLESVSSIILHSFKSKFNSLTSLSDEMMIDLLKASGFIESKSFEGYLVAEKDNEVLGILLLKWKGQNRVKSSNKLSFFKLGSKYGFMNLIKLLFGLSILSENISDDECYIEHVAVNQKSRGLGIGTMLINHGKKIAENKSKLNKYTLYVAKHNISAIRLYQKLGFSVKTRQNSILTQLLFKEKSWLYMVNNIKNKEEKPKFTMKSGWWLGFLGFIGFSKIPTALLFLKGNVSPTVLLGLLWFLWFSLFIPQKR